MKKPQVLATPGASEDNVKPEQEMNVMSKNSTAAAQIVPFRQAKLLLVDQGGEPFVPMKPVVEGMGLSWASQTVKLNGNQARWGVSIIEIPSSSGIQSYLCIPLRKLFGWMNTIHPSKVRKDLREDIIAYQNECDDVLWSYWNEGRAVRNDDRTVETVLNSTIGTDGFHMLGAIIKGKVVSLPQAVQRRATAKIWSQTHAAFGVRSAADIPADQLDAARNFIAAYAIEGEFLPRQEESGIKLTDSQAITLNLLVHHIAWVAHYWNAGIGQAAQSMDSPMFPGLHGHLRDCELHRSALDSSVIPEIKAMLAGKLPAGSSLGLRPAGMGVAA